MKVLKKVQLITDGACLGNPGPGGWAALLRYNPSSLYVDAVERYAGRIRRDPAALLVFYARSPSVR